MFCEYNEFPRALTVHATAPRRGATGWFKTKTLRARTGPADERVSSHPAERVEARIRFHPDEGGVPPHSHQRSRLDRAVAPTSVGTRKKRHFETGSQRLFEFPGQTP